MPLAASSEEADELGDVLLNLAYLLLDKGDERGAQDAAEAAAEAYANVQSGKEFQARELISAIDSTNS